MSTSLTLVSDFYEGRYNLIIYVGIAIAKLNHFASAISSDGKELMKPFKFTNDGYSFQMLQPRLVQLSRSGDSIIGFESITHYGNNLVRYLVACNYNVCVEPHQDIGHAQEQDR